jgi:hypothetical protein
VISNELFQQTAALALERKAPTAQWTEKRSGQTVLVERRFNAGFVLAA